MATYHLSFLTCRIPTIVLVYVLLIFLPQIADASEPEYLRMSNVSSEDLLKKGDGYKMHKPDSAMLCYSIIENRYESKMNEKDKKICIEALMQKWLIYFYTLYDYAGGYECLVKASEIAKESSMTVPYIDLQYGILYQVIGEQTGDRTALEKSFTYYMEGMKDALDQHDSKTLDVFASNLVWVAWYIDRLDDINEVWDRYSRTQDLDRHPDLKFILAYNLDLYRAVAELKKGNYKESLGVFDHLYETGPSGSRLSRYKYIPLVNKAIVMIANGHFEGASGILERLLRNSEVLGMKDMVMEAHQRLAVCYANLGKEGDALRHENASLKLKDSLINYTQMSRLEEVKSQSNLRSYQNQLVAVQADRKRHRTVTLVIAFLLVLVCAFLTVLFNRNRRLNSSNKELYLKNMDILRQIENEHAARKDYERRLEEMSSKMSASSDQGEDKAAEPSQVKYKGSRLEDSDKDSLLNSVMEAMRSHDEYLSADFSVDRLAELVGSKPKLVSQVINERTGCNFNSLVNEFRIREACRRISDFDNYGRLTLDAISKSVGFRSRSSFVAAFKSLTGLTPSEFQKIARSEHG